MIKLVRVDHRLVHGQVAFAWTKFLEADCILIASDDLMQNELKMAAMRMAKPTGVKLVMKNIEDSIVALNTGITDKYKLFILCESIVDVYRLAMLSPCITHINLGGMKNGEDRVQISKAVHVSNRDKTLLLELGKKGIELEIRLVPNDKKEDPLKLITSIS